METPNRNKRRENYETDPLQPAEIFIVKLLTTKISAFLEIYYLSAKGDKRPRLLDLGCGSQPLKERILEMGFDYHSLDIAPIENVKIDYVLNFGEDLTNPDLLKQKFDFIICTEVLEHTPNWGVFFKNLDLIAGPDAVVLLTSPFIYLLHEVPHDYFRATPYAYQYFAERNNFRVEKSEKAGTYYDVIGTIAGGSGKFVTYRKGLPGMFIKLFVTLLNILDKTYNKMIQSPLFRKYVNRESAYYLSNIVILKR
jgi:SAM-dependent methyltransferase